MARAALLLATEPLDRVTGRVTYSQQILKEFGWIDDGARPRRGDAGQRLLGDLTGAAREQTPSIDPRRTSHARPCRRRRRRPDRIPVSPLLALAQDAKLEVQKTDSVKTVLERHMGKRVSVVLTTGPEVAGIVTVVGDKVVQLSKLSGREFFDAVVAIDHIAAVIIRTDGR